ncbi:hypothetical protein [Variovorax sp. dw_308]|uniref:hypothetical protein n=1 Tax=Variovorax sp. dw_308 TaxID=2721546 RepID=UPI003528E4B3
MHGQRIRACLQQAELSPVPVPAQIAILMALKSRLFEPVTLDRMTQAQRAVQEAAAGMPVDLATRLVSADKLREEDQVAIIELARKAIVPFLPHAEASKTAPTEAP